MVVVRVVVRVVGWPGRLHQMNHVHRLMVCIGAIVFVLVACLKNKY